MKLLTEKKLSTFKVVSFEDIKNEVVFIDSLSDIWNKRLNNIVQNIRENKRKGKKK